MAAALCLMTALVQGATADDGIMYGDLRAPQPPPPTASAQATATPAPEATPATTDATTATVTAVAVNLLAGMLTLV
jgi:hypothetical protein